MMLVFHDNPPLELTSIRLASFNAFEAMDRALRKMFDNATCKATATGVIKAAIELGRAELAKEMQSDLDEIMSQERQSA